MSTNVNTIRDLAEQEYKWGFVTDIGGREVPKGLNEDIIRLISAKKNEPEFMLEWRLKAYRHWAVAREGRGRTEVGECQVSARSITRTSFITPRPSRSRTEEPGRSGSGDSAHLREAGHSAGGAEDARRRGGGCGVRQRLGGHDVQGEAGRSWALFFARSPKRCRSIRTWCRNISARWFLTPTTSSPR